MHSKWNYSQIFEGNIIYAGPSFVSKLFHHCCIYLQGPGRAWHALTHHGLKVGTTTRDNYSAHFQEILSYMFSTLSVLVVHFPIPSLKYSRLFEHKNRLGWKGEVHSKWNNSRNFEGNIIYAGPTFFSNYFIIAALIHSSPAECGMRWRITGWRWGWRHEIIILLTSRKLLPLCFLHYQLGLFIFPFPP